MTPEQRDLEMMKNPFNWPQLVLPLTRIRNTTELGILLGDKPVVYLCNMYNLPADFSTCRKIPYACYEDVVNDGWMVD